MNIFSIFDDNSLFVVKYKDEEYDELERLFNLWTDVEYLEEFFHENKENLQYFKVSVEEAVLITIQEAEKLEDLISGEVLLPFVSLHNSSFGVHELSEQKARFRWLRIYALRIENEVFLITGGAIKLTRTMQDNPITEKELAKLKQCINFLKENGVFDNDSFLDLLNEDSYE